MNPIFGQTMVWVIAGLVLYLFVARRRKSKANHQKPV